jgi:leucyl aminopeptidase
MQIAFSEPKLPTSGTLVVGVFEENVLTPAAKAADDRLNGALSRAMKAADFTGKARQTAELLAPAGSKLDRIMAIGMGKANALNTLGAEKAGGTLYTKLAKIAGPVIVLVEAAGKAGMGAPEIAAHMAFGLRLRAYRFDKYRTTMKKEDKPRLKKVAFGVKGAAAAKRAYQPLGMIGDGVHFTRDLVSEPANILYPESFAAEVKALTKLGVKVEVLGEKQMEKLGMGSLLGVGLGSRRESQLVVMQWNGAPKSKKSKPIAFVGKGVTFDTGGISIKPGNGMWDMKWDMGGAGVVSGLMKALAGRKAKVNVIGVLGLVENMPDGNAQRPGDVVTSMSGQTIEVLNTDAEGRLVLADALWYTQNRFKPEFMVNLATLTGAIVVALGNVHGGLFSNDDELARRLEAAGKAVDEPIWRFPLHADYDKAIDSPIADMKNISTAGGAGSITAAQFLQRFVNKVPWAHLDIAGVTWSTKDKPTVPKGATAFGVRLLERLVADHYEA